MNDLERGIIEFLRSHRVGDGVHVAAIGRAVKADPAIVRSVLSLLSAILGLN